MNDEYVPDERKPQNTSAMTPRPTGDVIGDLHRIFLEAERQRGIYGLPTDWKELQEVAKEYGFTNPARMTMGELHDTLLDIRIAEVEARIANKQSMILAAKACEPAGQSPSETENDRKENLLVSEPDQQDVIYVLDPGYRHIRLNGKEYFLRAKQPKILEALIDAGCPMSEMRLVEIGRGEGELRGLFRSGGKPVDPVFGEVIVKAVDGNGEKVPKFYDLVTRAIVLTDAALIEPS